MDSPDRTVDKIPVPIVRLLGEIHEKVNAINAKADTALTNQREMKREVGCIVKTWEEFNGTYGTLLEAQLKREKAREKLRDALIEKGLLVALVATLGFLATASWEKAVHAAQQFLAK